MDRCGSVEEEAKELRTRHLPLAKDDSLSIGSIVLSIVLVVMFVIQSEDGAWEAKLLAGLLLLVPSGVYLWARRLHDGGTSAAHDGLLTLWQLEGPKALLFGVWVLWCDRFRLIGPDPRNGLHAACLVLSLVALALALIATLRALSLSGRMVRPGLWRSVLPSGDTAAAGSDGTQNREAELSFALGLVLFLYVTIFLTFSLAFHDRTFHGLAPAGAVPKGDLDLLDYLYFMIYTITTTGYGDFQPTSAMVKFICSVANLLEVLFLVLIFNVAVGFAFVGVPGADARAATNRPQESTHELP